MITLKRRRNPEQGQKEMDRILEETRWPKPQVLSMLTGYNRAAKFYDPRVELTIAHNRRAMCICERFLRENVEDLEDFMLWTGDYDYVHLGSLLYEVAHTNKSFAELASVRAVALDKKARQIKLDG